MAPRRWRLRRIPRHGKPRQLRRSKISGCIQIGVTEAGLESERLRSSRLRRFEDRLVKRWAIITAGMGRLLEEAIAMDALRILYRHFAQFDPSIGILEADAYVDDFVAVLRAQNVVTDEIDEDVAKKALAFWSNGTSFRVDYFAGSQGREKLRVEWQTAPQPTRPKAWDWPIPEPSGAES